MVTVAANLKDITITEDILEKNINYAWNEKYQSYSYDDTEKTALILNNLYDVIIENPVLLNKAYEALIELNSKNFTIVHRLKLKHTELMTDIHRTNI